MFLLKCKGFCLLSLSTVLITSLLLSSLQKEQGDGAVLNAV